MRILLQVVHSVDVWAVVPISCEGGEMGDQTKMLMGSRWRLTNPADGQAYQCRGCVI